MSVTLNASTSSGFIATSDTSGNLELQANGTTKATVSSSGLAIGQYNPSASLITSDTAKSATSTSVDFTGIPSWVKRITVMFNGVSTNGSSKYLIQLGDSGGIETTSYDCASTYGSSGNSDTATSSAGFILNQQGLTQVYSGIMTINYLGSNIWISSHAMSFSGGASIYGGGSKTLSATLDRVRITTVNGTDTFDAGTINILYE